MKTKHYQLITDPNKKQKVNIVLIPELEEKTHSIND